LHSEYGMVIDSEVINGYSVADNQSDTFSLRNQVNRQQYYNIIFLLLFHLLENKYFIIFWEISEFIHINE
jgi:hypothetical protein